MNKILKIFNSKIFNIYNDNFPDYLRLRRTDFRKSLNKYNSWNLWIQHYNKTTQNALPFDAYNINKIRNNNNKTNKIKNNYEINNLIGFSLLYNFPHKKFIHLDYIAIDKQFQGKGYGKQYLNYIIENFLMKQKNINYLTLECENKLIGFYEKFGFIKVNINYYYRGIKLNLMILSKNIINLKLNKIKIGNYLLNKFNSNLTSNSKNNLIINLNSIPISFCYLFLLQVINKLRYHIFDSFKSR
jgi:ribosomal protein S18 acetylase RimI-like enzyme